MQQEIGKEYRVQADGEEYVWHIRRWPSWCWTNDDYNGLSLSITLADARKRELIVDFPFERKQERHKVLRQMPKIPDEKIVRYINEGRELGWLPDSRGKAFVIESDF